MDKQKLDNLLSQQDRLDDDNFTSSVMNQLPRHSQEKRNTILISCLLLGSFSSFLIFPSSTQFFNFLGHHISEGPTAFLISFSIIVFLLCFTGAFIITASDEV